MATVFAVVHDDGRTSRMTAKRFAAVQNQGWRLADAHFVVENTDTTIADVLADVGDDPVKASAAIDVERDGKNRPTLIKKLTAIVDGTADPGVTPEKEQ